MVRTLPVHYGVMSRSHRATTSAEKTLRDLEEAQTQLQEANSIIESARVKDQEQAQQIGISGSPSTTAGADHPNV